MFCTDKIGIVYNFILYTVVHYSTYAYKIYILYGCYVLQNYWFNCLENEHLVGVFQNWCF